MMYYEMYQQGGQWRWRLKAANHEILASGESYTTKANCEKVIELLKATTPATPVNEV
jgi:uncharacterized protein YegP (UPF0339 family)